MNVDHLFSRRYHIDHYNCVHFLCEAWQAMFNEDLSDRLKGFLRAVSDKQFIRADIRTFKRIAQPADPCIVLFQAPHQSPHVGLFYRRKVLHITPQGVQRVPLSIAAMGFSRVRFYQ